MRQFGAEVFRHFDTSLMVPKCLGSEVSWIWSVLTPYLILNLKSSDTCTMHVIGVTSGCKPLWMGTIERSRERKRWTESCSPQGLVLRKEAQATENNVLYCLVIMLSHCCGHFVTVGCSAHMRVLSNVFQLTWHCHIFDQLSSVSLTLEIDNFYKIVCQKYCPCSYFIGIFCVKCSL